MIDLLSESHAAEEVLSLFGGRPSASPSPSMPHPPLEHLRREQVQRVNPVPQMGFAARDEERYLEQQHQAHEPKPRQNHMDITEHGLSSS
jgi:hypothetical protein